ncbi:MAG TPA: MlaD family protein [Solirubrobacterales bacterium]|nr:MlaD family protein [Solirubrobacterales bacterium]
METRPPTIVQLLVAVAFALSCFALLLFLWISFGGPTPLKPEGYRIEVPFDEATQLAVESDVRISGVSVGKVKQIELSDSGKAVATLEIDAKYAPLPDDTKAILRQKTLLGETYVELSPGSPGNPGESDSLGAQGGTADVASDGTGFIPEEGSLPEAQVSEAVQLDEIFRTFDEPTREAFQTWMQDASVAFRGRGADLNAAIGNLEPFATTANEVLRILDSQRLATREFIRNTGEVFEALSERRGQLQGLIRNSNTVFATTAARNEDLQQAFIALPTFLDESRLTLTRLEQFANDTDPLVQQLRPAAQELSPTLIDLGRLAPELKGFFRGLLPAAQHSKRGFEALQDVLSDQLPAVLTKLDPWMRNVIPILQVVFDYRHEVTALVANTAAATNGFNRAAEAGNNTIRYLRTTAPLGPEALAAYPNRLKVSRTNPYVAPQGYLNLSSSLEGFETRQCTAGLTALLDPNSPMDPDFYTRFSGTTAEQQTQAQDFFDRLKRFAFVDELNSDNLPTPPCKQQGAYTSVGGAFPEFSQYLHVYAQP